LKNKWKRPKHFITKTGVEVRSGYEQRVLDNLTDRGYEYEYEPFRIPWSSTVRSGRCTACKSKSVVKARTYTPDVLIEGRCVVEIKGFLKATDRTILKGVVESAGGERPLTHILFQRNNWITTKKVKRCTDWARSVGLISAVGEEIPDAWIS